VSKINDKKLAAPCGLYCGACIAYSVKDCHGCGCNCGACDAIEHHKSCEIYKCCVQKAHLEACCECENFPCSLLIRFCNDPVWRTHLAVIENLRRRKKIGSDKWLEEQEQVWKNQRYLNRWLWFQKECAKRNTESKKESEGTHAST
jgi:hypothetical protein